MKKAAQLVLFFLAATQGALRCQVESPRQLSGSLVLGWMDTTAEEFFRERRSNPFTTLRLDYQSYLFAPDFLTYRIQPRLSSGFQDGFTGMSEGSGVAFESVFLPRRPWPFRFHYARFRRSSLTSGLGSSYSRFLSQNEDSTIGFQWQYSVPTHPTFELSFDKVATATTPEEVLTQGFETRSRTLSLTGHDVRKGWTLNGGLTFQKLDNQYLLGSDTGAVLVENKNKVKNLLFLAQRPLPKDLNLFLSANRTANRNDFDRGRFDQAFDSYSTKLEYRPEGKFQAWTQARLTRSELEFFGSEILGGPSFQLPSSSITNRMLDSEARYQIHPYLNVFGRNEFTRVSAPVTGELQRAGNFTNTGGGMQFFRSRNSFVLAGSYYLYSTRTDFERASSARLLGHAADGSVSIGDTSTVRVAGGLSVSRSNEQFRTILPVTSGSERVRLAVARTVFHRWTIELQGALTRNRYDRQELRSNFTGKDYGVSLTGPRYYLGYSRSIGAGDSLQPLLGLSTVAPANITGPLLLVLGSSNSTTALSASWNVSRRMSIRGIWRGQVQTVGSLLSSRFEEQQATLNYSFRRVRFEAGYLVYRFNFGSPILRKSIIFRLTRDFRIF